MKKTTSCAAYGAALGFMSVEDSMTIVHGSRSCQAMMYSAKSVRENGKHRFIDGLGDLQCRSMICTDMTEKDAVFGGEDLLRNRLSELYDSGTRNIFVTTTCAPGITGDRCKDVCERFGKTHSDAHVGCVEASGNMTGDWEEGFVNSSEVLSGFIDDPVEEEDSVNILAERYFYYFKRNIDNYMLEILKDFNLKVNTRYLYRSRFDEIRRMGNAACNISAMDDYITDCASKHVSRHSGAKNLSAPIGFKQYEKWADEMSRIFKPRDSLAATVSENNAFHESLVSSIINTCRGKRVLVYHDDTDRFDWQLEGLKELEMEPLVIARTPNHGPALSNPGKTKVIPAESVSDFDGIMRDFSPDLIISDVNIGLSKPSQYYTSDSRLITERNDVRFDVPLLKQLFPGVGVKGYSKYLQDIALVLSGRGCGSWRSDRF